MGNGLQVSRDKSFHLVWRSLRDSSEVLLGSFLILRSQKSKLDGGHHVTTDNL